MSNQDPNRGVYEVDVNGPGDTQPAPRPLTCDPKPYDLNPSPEPLESDSGDGPLYED